MTFYLFTDTGGETSAVEGGGNVAVKKSPTISQLNIEELARLLKWLDERLQDHENRLGLLESP